MSRSHTIECERCHKKEELKYNGEHFLAPEDWSVLIMNNGKISWDLCLECTQRALEGIKKPLKEEQREKEIF